MEIALVLGVCFVIYLLLRRHERHTELRIGEEIDRRQDAEREVVDRLIAEFQEAHADADLYACWEYGVLSMVRRGVSTPAAQRLVDEAIRDRLGDDRHEFVDALFEFPRRFANGGNEGPRSMTAARRRSVEKTRDKGAQSSLQAGAKPRASKIEPTATIVRLKSCEMCGEDNRGDAYKCSTCGHLFRQPQSGDYGSAF